MLSESSDDHRRRGTGKRKKEKRRHKRLEKEEKEMDDYNKESFKKMKKEIEELRKKELEREKELENLKNMIESKEREKEIPTKVEYTLDFDRDEYLKKGFIESAKWLKSVVAAKLSEKIQDEKFKSRFECFTIAKKASIHLGMRTCARFNRGEECNLGRWHLTHRESTEPIRPKQLWTRNHQQQQQFGQQHFGQHQFGQQQFGQLQVGGETNSRRNEIRLHACTICLDTFGAAFGHSTLNCPWILKKNWILEHDDSD
jgi:hypothetical protein